MEIIYVDNDVEGGKKAFEILKKGIEEGSKVLGLATGSTPETLYQEMIKSELQFTNLVSVNLDEYIGLGKEDKQSYHFFMNDKLFNKKPFKKSYLPNGKATNLEKECKDYNEVIDNHPIDIQILGLGHNGHIGFNEPGTDFDEKTHVVELTQSTINANKRYFSSTEVVPSRAISMGINSIMPSKKIVLMAYGEEKADAVKKMIEGPITAEVPASALQEHDNIVVILDKAAASKLSSQK